MRNGFTMKTKIPFTVKVSRVNPRWAQVTGTRSLRLADRRTLGRAVREHVSLCVLGRGGQVASFLYGVVA